ncbi:MAG: Rpn family recombination-promoting nuclease/putative transposase [Gammaproteobacteria bacterium]|nr:Rpn family recombination-promoting nuclease/putative transposase [Gammaproteobacteria bacterium]
MAPTTVAEMARQFPENGMKLLLSNPHNMRDLLALTGSELARRIDTDRMHLMPTTLVRQDYRHVESDLVLSAPLHAGAGPPRDLLVFVLIEHQSAPDRMMPLRLLEYVVQIFNQQTRQWAKKHRSLAQLLLQPVLPIVFYTGTRPWESVGRLSDLVAAGEWFEQVTPVLDPLFVNLPQLDTETLERIGGAFGWVLQLVQQRKRSSAEFRPLLGRGVQQLEGMPPAERLRWL